MFVELLINGEIFTMFSICVTCHLSNAFDLSTLNFLQSSIYSLFCAWSLDIDRFEIHISLDMTFCFRTRFRRIRVTTVYHCIYHCVIVGGGFLSLFDISPHETCGLKWKLLFPVCNKIMIALRLSLISINQCSRSIVSIANQNRN